MLGRLRQRADFERLLATPPCSRGPHFALHYLQHQPSRGGKPSCNSVGSNLSTGNAPISVPAVDDLSCAHWLGSVIPKRHARRAVTRNVLRRQIRAAVTRRQAALKPGLWLVRLRRPLTDGGLVSADSRALRRDAAAELDRMLSRMVDRHPCSPA